MALNKRSSEYVKANDDRFGLRVSSKAPNCNKVNSLQCRFCIAFGCEEKVGAKRKPSTDVQGWIRPFRYDNIENHVSGQHPAKWAEYKLLDSSDDRKAFFDDVLVSFKNSMKAHFPSSSLGTEREMVFNIEKDIVDVIVGDMMFEPNDDIIDSDPEDDMDEPPAFSSDAERNVVLHRQAQQSVLAKERALSLFKRIDGDDDADYAYCVTIPKSKTTVFQLAVRYVACGTSFRMAANLLSCTYNVLHNLILRSCSRNDVSNFIRVVYVVNLQHMACHLRHSWAFSIALDSATHQSTSYLDLRFRIFLPAFYDIVNVHAAALPMFDWHTGEVMYKMVAVFLNVMCPVWTVRLLGISFDGARNMMGRVAGVVTHLTNAMHNECPLIRVWCGAHQLDLIMEYIMNSITTCPRVVNRWLSTEKVIKWFKAHRPQLLAHIESKQPPSAPPRIWWVFVLAMHHFTSLTAITFRTIQGLSTLLDQQQAALDDLVTSFIDDVGVIGPLSPEAIANLEVSEHVISGRYAVQLSSVREFVSGLASWADSIVDEVDPVQRNDLWNDIASVYVTACDRVSQLSSLRDADNNALANPSSLPLHHYSVDHIDVIADEHKLLLHAYRSEPVLKQAIDGLDSQSSFRDGWSLIGSIFPNLMEFCGVLATIFLGTSTVESDFSVLRWEKDNFRKSLSDFGLEGVMQSKQWTFLEQFEQ
ncbi:unnamed protein product [Sphagnum jensenii]